MCLGVLSDGGAPRRIRTHDGAVLGVVCVANCVARTEFCVASISLAAWPRMAVYGVFKAGQGDGRRWQGKALPASTHLARLTPYQEVIGC